MFLKNLRLTNYRNFTDLDLGLEKTTLLLGDNAQGKSNLLESVYFLATTKSLRADPDIQLIQQGEGFCRVEGEVTDSQEDEMTKLEIAMQKRLEEGGGGLTKQLKVNGVPRRTLDYIGNLVVIHFSPEDINLVSGPPALRRWHMDLVLAQVDREYKRIITDYVSVVASRNKLLKRIKEGQAKREELEFWDEKLIEFGHIVSEKREAFFNYLNSHTSQNSNTFTFVYKANLVSIERLVEYRPREIVAAASLIGPHRDDFIFEMNGRNLAHFGSRGEQRISVLELKLAELKFVTQLIDDTPVLLLDDVFSELDEEHREHVISLIGGQQTIISAVAGERIPEKLLKVAKTVYVKQGQVSVPG